MLCEDLPNIVAYNYEMPICDRLRDSFDGRVADAALDLAQRAHRPIAVQMTVQTYLNQSNKLWDPLKAQIGLK